MNGECKVEDKLETLKKGYMIRASMSDLVPLFAKILEK